MFKTGGIAIINKQGRSKPPLPIPLTKENSFLVFPFDLTAGYITSTENGLRQNDNIDIEDYSNFQRIFTGLESMIAQWQGAYKVEKKTPDATVLTKTYQVGRSIRAFIPSEDMSASFEPSTISGDFLAEFTEESFEMHTYEELEDKDLFRLFIIPELHENKWLYVGKATNFYWNGEYHHSEITLQTLNNKIAKSGASVESFVQRGAPGEGYAWPITDKDGNVAIDQARAADVPITSMQVELSGAAAINTFIAYGRPTITKKENGTTITTFNPDIAPPRLLLPIRIETPIPSPENTRPSAETDFYVGDMSPTLYEQYNDWKDQFSASFDLSQRSQFEGVLIGGTMADLRNSNPLAGGGTHDHIMWDSKWKINIPTKTRDTRPNGMTDDNITLNGLYFLNEVLSHEFFITSHITTLPLSVQQNIPWTVAKIPLVGGILTKATFGIPLGWNNTAYRYQMGDVKLMFPTSIAEYGNKMKAKDNADVWIPLETFTGQRKDEATEFSGINSTGTILKVSLTHLFKKTINSKEYIFDTKDLGQDMPAQDAQGTPIPSPTGKLLWDATCKPASRGDVPGYVIDAPHFKAIAKMDYRLTFFSNDLQAWTGTYQTKGKFTGNIRDWLNTMKLSNWNEDTGQTLNYPKDITDPTPPDKNYPDVEINPEHTETTLRRLLDYLVETGQVIYDASGTYKKYTFVGSNQEKIAEVYSQEIDLTPYGGLTAFRNNYQTIDIYTQEFGNISADIDQLITSGELNLPYSGEQFSLGAKGKVSGDDYPETDAGISETNLDIAYRFRLKLVVSGGKIVFKIFIGLVMYGLDGASPNTRRNHGWAQTPKTITTTTFDKIVLKPKNIS